MRLTYKSIIATAALVLAGLVSGGSAAAHKDRESAAAGQGEAVLWRDPADLETRDLYYGSGGRAHEPQEPFTFVKEDTSGSNPKFEVTGRDGIHWNVKMGPEAHPEVAASRLVWAAGYFANEDYFVPVLHVQNMQHLERGGSHVKRDGTVREVRLKRRSEDQGKLGIWSWENSPFTGTREWYGLRALMAFMNNWDLKDVNNSVYQVREPRLERRYLVSDLGASFGPAGMEWKAKGSLRAYERSKWIDHVSGGLVDFNVPSTPSFIHFFAIPDAVRRVQMTWIGQNIPVEHAKWLGGVLARLSPRQIRDAFRAAGYTPEEIEGFSQVVERRIRELNGL